jgi:hypothetical protein
MKTLEKNPIKKRYWITWSISSLIGLLMFITSLQGPHLCSPVVGCVVESIMFYAIIVSIILLVIRLFKKNKLKLITPLILIFFFIPSTIIFVTNTI